MGMETFYNLSKERQQAIINCGIFFFSNTPYKEVSTDVIVTRLGISKGILFHYFKTKKAFYLFLLQTCMDCLTQSLPEVDDRNDFAEILFETMDQKISLCKEHPDMMHMVNMASREVCSEVVNEKNALLAEYRKRMQQQSAFVMARAVAKLGVQGDRKADALLLYSNAVINRYLAKYQEKPDDFFKQTEAMKAELKEYLGYMLNGVLAK